MVVMVDAFVEKVVEMLISTVTGEVETQVGLVVGVENQVEKLKNNLESIQAVLIDADRRQLKEISVQLWLDRLKEVTYDIDDVFDEWNVRILKSQIHKDEISQSTMKVWSFKFLSLCSCFPMVSTRHHIAVKINDLNERLDAIAIEKDRYDFQLLTANNEQVERNITTSVIDVSEVKGREADKEKLVAMLLSEKSHVSNLHLIPVVGMGGIGKTTLAKLVYHDERVKSHFDKRIWVCVSDPFDETKITKEILETLEGSAPNLVSLSNMMGNLQESVQGKKILFVLDDVWNEDPRKWKQLGDCLKSSLSGSCVLVTTRNENVGKTMGCFESDIYRIGLLSNEESWELFCMVAFSRKSRGERASLEEIGRELVSRCKGLPLALRTIAGLLQFKTSRMEWQDVLESELWDLEEVRRDFLAPLWLSYYNLASPLKECFSYCAIFPKDYVMEKYKLIRSWMAQGYIKGKQSEDLEKIGDRYFQNLVVRSLFQDVEVKNGRYGHTQTWCKMHDLVHDFAQSLVKKECLSMEVDVGVPISIDNSFRFSLRHLGIDFRGKIQSLDSIYNLKKLRSFQISRSMIDRSLLDEVLDLQKTFDKFTCLRSLCLFHCGIEEIPPNISKLIHLRELDLSCNFWIRKLPDSLWKLCNLQTLILILCSNLKSLEGLGRLTNLRHIDCSDTNVLFPKETVKLSSLRRLHEVRIDVDKRESFSLKHLKNLKQLGGSLHIRWLKHCDGNVEDAKEAQMKDKKHITELHLQLCDKETEGRRKQDEDLMEALTPPPNLEILKIGSYMGSKPPSWMTSLTCLELICLYHWRTECLPALGKLPCLNDLRLERFYSIEKVGPEFLGMDEELSSNVPLFPKLRTLHFEHFDDWKEWKDIDGKIMIMPNLTSLKLFVCPELEALPNFILQKIGLKSKVRSCHALEKFLISRGLEYEREVPELSDFFRRKRAIIPMCSRSHFWFESEWEFREEIC